MLVVSISSPVMKDGVSLACFGGGDSGSGLGGVRQRLSECIALC